MKVVYLILLLCANAQGLEVDGSSGTDLTGSSIRSTFKKVMPSLARRPKQMGGDKGGKESRTMMKLSHFKNRIGRYGDEFLGKGQDDEADGESDGEGDNAQPSGTFEFSDETATSTESSAADSSVAPSLVLTSPKSWISAFLNHKSQSNKEHKVKVMEVDEFGNKLKSNIIDYGESQSEVDDLRKWTQVLANDKGSNSKFNDYNYKQYGIVGDRNDKQRLSQIDIDEFIRYLVEHENFNVDDLSFLKSTDIDHGVEDIERELNKIKQRENEASRSIVIGGEFENSSSRIAAVFNAYIVMTLYFFLI